MMNTKRQKLLNGNLRKLLFTFSLPTVIGMIVASLYNLVDTILWVRESLLPGP